MVGAGQAGRRREHAAPHKALNRQLLSEDWQSPGFFHLLVYSCYKWVTWPLYAPVSSYTWGAKCVKTCCILSTMQASTHQLSSGQGVLTRQLCIKNNMERQQPAQQAERGNRGSHRAPVQVGHGTAGELWWLQHSMQLATGRVS